MPLLNEAVESARQQLGLNDPLPQQYIHWLGGLFKRDLGVTHRTQQPVVEAIGNSFMPTMWLALAGFAWSVVLGLLPGTLPSVIVYFTMRIGTSILTAASLSFIGLGPEPDVPEWGNILAMSRSLMMAGLWHVSVFPGLAIFFTVLAFNLLGDTLDPKLKS